ncbi:MAG TPA: hypothetical protein PLB01_00360 [Thermoanaerobaculia bacterium]|nr:hypothetical protein [Thermoanaerobaculia bacterium]
MTAEVKVAGPYDPFPALAELMKLANSPAGQAWLERRLEDAGISQAELEAKAKELQPPEQPA